MLVFKDVSDMIVINKYIADNKLEELYFEDGLFFGALEDDHLFGLCQVNFDEKGIAMGMIYISESHRGNGYGNAMVRSLFNKLEINGINFIYSPSTNPYLDKLGFRFHGEDYGCNLNELFSGSCSCCGDDH